MYLHNVQLKMDQSESSYNLEFAVTLAKCGLSGSFRFCVNLLRIAAVR